MGRELDRSHFDFSAVPLGDARHQVAYENFLVVDVSEYYADGRALRSTPVTLPCSAAFYSLPARARIAPPHRNNAGGVQLATPAPLQW